MKNSKYILGLLFILGITFTACDKDDPVIPEEPELITTLNYYLTPVDGGESIIMSFQDLDGDGGNAPIITSATLASNQMYNGRLELLNEVDSPAEDITEEIAEEDEDHQFFFQTDISDLSINYSDEDDNGNPVGLSTTLSTGAAGAGTITITLRHEPSKSEAGVSNGIITNAGGETDIEVTFSVNVE